MGVDVEIVTENIDYFERQSEIADISSRLSGSGDDKSPYIQVTARWGDWESISRIV